MLALYILALIPCVLLCALGNRWAGGLLSVWVGKDLGNTKVRILWGLTTVLPFFVFYNHLRWQHLWIIPAILLVGVLQGLMRGAGWGGSLTLGFVNGKPSEKTWDACATMLPRTLMMNTVVWVGASVLLNIFPAVPGALLLVTGFGWVGLYILAWLRPIQYPKLGLLHVDPPPTAELLCGGLTGLLVYITCWLA